MSKSILTSHFFLLTLVCIITISTINSVYGQINIDKLIKDRMNSEESAFDEIIITPEDLKESNLTKTYTDLNLKIKIHYPDYWKKLDFNSPVVEKALCQQIVCIVAFDLLKNGFTTNTFFGAISHDDWILDGCDCKNLTNSIKWLYDHKKNYPGFSFIDDSQITINNNISAWQMEYLYNLVYARSVITMFNEKIFEFVLEAPVQNYYNQPYYHIKFIKDFKNVVNSIEFLASIKSVKQPSFLK